jgi:thioredoxin reductase
VDAQYKIAIVGSGPAGLSAAARAAALDREAGREQPSYILLEAFEYPSKTIFRYQKGKYVMAEPGYLKLRSDFTFDAGLRETILGAWDDGISEAKVNIRLKSEVVSLAGSKGNFQLTLSDGESVNAEHIVFAIGTEGNPRKLGVSGDTPDNVQYQLDDPREFSGKHVLVVGAGDAAVENAVALAEQNHVIIINRRDEFARVKDGNQVLILNAISDPTQTLDCRYSSSIKEIEAIEGGESRMQVALKTPEGIEEVPADLIIARLGSVPSRRFMEACGLEFPNAGPNALPELSEHYESNVPGLYIVGSLAGFPLIKQAMNQGYDVVEFINGNMIKPVDTELLGYQFQGLPFMREVPELLKLMMERIPMFRQLNTLAFRELVIESRVYASYADDLAAEEATQEISALEKKIADDFGSESSRPGTTRIVKEGEVLFREGDRGVCLFIVVAGEVMLE